MFGAFAALAKLVALATPAVFVVLSKRYASGDKITGSINSNRENAAALRAESLAAARTKTCAPMLCPIPMTPRKAKTSTNADKSSANSDQWAIAVV